MMGTDVLTVVQKLQFTDLPAANSLLKEFFANNLPLKIRSVDLRPLPVSLNSITGIVLTMDDEKFFFKAHIEPSSADLEYYNADLLERAGYPTLKPIFRTPGTLTEHILLYEVVQLPTLFEVMRSADRGEHHAPAQILTIHEKLDDHLWQIYSNTLRTAGSAEHMKSPVHQLFHNRLTGGRLDFFYPETATIRLAGVALTFAELCNLHWIINGVSYSRTLRNIIDEAVCVLNPSSFNGPAIVGHGDAHNGNLFVDQGSSTVIYFDPAFAGLHSPFLDLVKPLYHNTFGQWLYFPAEVNSSIRISVSCQNGELYVDHDYAIPDIRLQTARSKITRVLRPMINALADMGELPASWQSVLRSAFACCPLLTMDLSDPERFPDSVRTLGFSHVVQCGSLGSVHGCGIGEIFADILS